MRIDFNERTHTYAINGEIAVTSITALLRKHGLAPDYSKVDSDVLNRKAEYGKEIHKDCELAINDPTYEPKTWQGIAYRKWVNATFNGAVAEQLLGLDFKNSQYYIGGTADLVAIDKNGAYAVADIKNTASVHKEYESWQQSLEDYFLRNATDINGKSFKGYNGAKSFISVHFSGDDEMAIIFNEKVPDDEIEKLLQAELDGEIYQRPMLVVDSDILSKWHTAEAWLAETEKAYKKASEEVKAFREKLCNLMEEQNIQSYEDDTLKITYKTGYDRLSVDSTKLKREYPNAYTACQKLTRVKASVVVKIKDNEEGDDYDF